MARAFCAALVVLLPTPVAAASPLQQARQDVQEKPSDPVGWEKLGSLLRRDRQWKEAEHSFRKALDLRAPSIQESLSGLGTALFEQERFEEAIAHFRAAVVLSPERPQVHENLALALEEDGQLEEAIQSLRRSLTLAPRNVKAKNFLGELLTQATRFREAEETFRESLAIDPNRAETNRQMGDALLLRQAYEEALPHLSKAVQADMDGDQDPWKDLAYTLEFMGRDAEAEELYRLVLQNTSAKPDLLWRISRLAKSRGKPKEAEELLRLAIKQKEEDEEGSYSARHYRDLGSAIFLQGREEEARETWRGIMQRLVADGMSLVHFNTNFGKKEGKYQARLKWEAEEFEEHCGSLDEALSEPLLTMVRSVRNMENSTDWLLTWADETTRLFGGGRLISYGVTYFPAWRKAVQHPMVKDAMASATKPLAMLVGSALGYQCAFALSLGFERCVGYDLLCASMVSLAQKLVEEIGLSHRIQFHCADALTAPELKEAALVWINDDCFPRDFSRALKARMASELPPRAVFVSYKAAELEEPDWQMGSTLTVKVSWNSKQFLHIFRRKTLEEAEACEADSCAA